MRCAALGVLRLSPKQLPFDSTLGYPGEGPTQPRPDVDLRTFRALTPMVAARRAVRLREFLVHVQLWDYLDATSVMQLPSADLDRLLANFGHLLYRGGRSLLDYSETINAIVDEDRGLKGRLPQSK